MDEHEDLEDYDDVEEEDQEQHHKAGGGGSRKRKSKRDPHAMRKAPHAPKRFKSSYICFFMAKQGEIKESLGDEATVALISKRSAEMWKTLPAEERAYWDDVAAKDKERYMAEKSTYTGPWQVPWKRARKDPSAPKRPMSAFLQFSQGRRTRLKEENPEMKNTEISRLLGEMWRNASEEEKRPYVEKEKEEREEYKKVMAVWRKQYEEKQEAERKAQHQPINDFSQYHSMAMTPYTAEPMHFGHPMMTQQPYAHHGYGLGPYAFPTDGKHVILGPNGMPVIPHAPSIPQKDDNLGKSEELPEEGGLPEYDTDLP